MGPLQNHKSQEEAPINDRVSVKDDAEASSSSGILDGIPRGHILGSRRGPSAMPHARSVKLSFHQQAAAGRTNSTVHHHSHPVGHPIRWRDLVGWHQLRPKLGSKRRRQSATVTDSGSENPSVSYANCVKPSFVSTSKTTTASNTLAGREEKISSSLRQPDNLQKFKW
ncbi:hypothetical protein ACLOJK_014751, partial [Asimina triloba]